MPRAGDGSPTVLIVDDDASIRGMLGYLLHDEGYDVHEAADGIEAIAALMAEDDGPDCMILDLMMPNVDGIQVLRTRNERGLAPDTRVLVLTAKTDTKDAVWCWELGADEYLNKPVDPDRLAREVRQLLARSPVELQRRRTVGLADARERDKFEAAFTPKDAR
jgi:DNA-binding response OmpR family regulator